MFNNDILTLLQKTNEFNKEFNRNSHKVNYKIHQHNENARALNQKIMDLKKFWDER